MLSAHEGSSEEATASFAQDASNLRNALKSCVERANENLEVLEGIGLDGVWIWLIRPCISHPLRAIYSGESFFLISKRSDPLHDGEEERINLYNIISVDVGHKPTNASGLLGVSHQQSDGAFCEKEIPYNKNISAPVTLDLARYIMALFCSLGSLDIDAAARISPLFVLTNNGLHESPPSKSYLGAQSLHTENDHCTVIYHLSAGGWVSKEDEQGCGPIPSTRSVIDDSRLQLGGAPANNDLQLQSLFRAKYDILAESLFKTGANSPLSSIILDAVWKGTHKLLSGPPPSAHITMRIRCVPGDVDTENQLPTALIRKELQKLSEWDRIRCGDEWSSGSDGTEFAPDSRMSPNLVDEWLKQIKDEGFVMAETVKGSENTTFDLDSHNALTPRQDLDFPERFWNFAQEHTSSRGDLVIALNGVIEELETGKLQPMVNKTNHSSFARVIRDCYKLVRMQTAPDYDDQKEATSRTFDYWLEEPLELIVEIGIWKLKRDYCYHLIGNELASWDQLDSFVDAALPLEEQVGRLRRLHRILELWSLVKANVLQMPGEGLRTLVQAALEHYSDSEEGDGIVDDAATVLYRFVLPRFSSETGKALAGMVTGFEPSMWSIMLTDAEEEGKGDSVSSAGTPAYMVVFDRADSIFGDTSNIHRGSNFEDYDDMEALTDQMLAGSNRWRWVTGTVSTL